MNNIGFPRLRGMRLLVASAVSVASGCSGTEGNSPTTAVGGSAGTRSGTEASGGVVGAGNSNSGGSGALSSGGGTVATGGGAATGSLNSGGSGALSSGGGTVATGGGAATGSLNSGGSGALSSGGGTVATGGGVGTGGDATSTGGTSATSAGGGSAMGGAASGGGSAAGGTSAAVPVTFLAEPTFAGNDNPAAPLVGVLRLETDVPASVEVGVSGGGEQWALSLLAATKFEKPIVGLKPETTYSVSISATAGQNTLTAGPLEWTTPALPLEFPPLEVALSSPTEMEPGMTLFNVRVGRDTSTAAIIPMVIVDHDGVVRWYYADPENPVPEDHRRLANGNFLFIMDRCSMREVDILGNTVGMWQAAEYPRACAFPSGSIEVPIQSFQHEVSMRPDGTFLVLSTESRTVDDFPSSETNPDAPAASALIVGGVVAEFNRQGELLKYVSLMDLLDPTRIGRSSLDTQSPTYYVPEGEEAYDWDHANAVIYDDASDSYYVSLRHQDAVIKVNRTTETLTWILGTPSNWDAPWSDKLLSPLGSLEWPYHQHAVELTPTGVGMYDNGNFRAAAFETAQTQYSRAVIYSVDESAMTVSEVWSYGDPSGSNSFFAAAMGDADWQPETGNVVMVNAQLQDQGGSYGQILEVKPDGTRVFELNVRGGGAGGGNVFAIYRAQRVADIRE